MILECQIIRTVQNKECEKLALAATRFEIEKRYIGSIKSVLAWLFRHRSNCISFSYLIFAYFSYGDIKDH